MAAEQESESYGLKPSGIVVVDAPKFDLESYLSNYDGITRLDRLILIGTSSKPLASDALKAALAEAKQGANVRRFLDIISYLQQSASADVAAADDPAWVEKTRKIVDKETERLESELKGYKNNLIKESIRMGNEELGAHYHTTGDLASAQKAYTRMRDYCTTQKQLVERDLKLALLAISQHNYISLQSNVLRAQGAVLSQADTAKFGPCIPPLLGLASLASSDYRAAALQFLRTDVTFITGLEPVAGGILVNRQVLSANDVATYGTLSALATFNRADLRSLVLESPTFRQFLELEPHLRRAVTAFVGAKYTTVLATLNAYRTDYLLDLHLQRHVTPLWAMIRRKSIVSFFGPFDRVSVQTMVEAFGGTEEDMLAELAEMVEQGLLHARVDAVDGLLIAKGSTTGSNSDAANRRAQHEKALRMAGEQERAMRLKLWRIQMVDHGMEMKSSKGDGGADRWGDEGEGGFVNGAIGDYMMKAPKGGRGGGGGGHGGGGGPDWSGPVGSRGDFGRFAPWQRSRGGGGGGQRGPGGGGHGRGGRGFS